MSEESLQAWERRLAEAMTDLERREAETLAEGATSEQLMAFAEERDKVAAELDDLAAGYSEAAESRDERAENRDLRASRQDAWLREQIAGAHHFADRMEAAAGRDDAAGDRAEARLDRGRAAAARTAASKDRGRAADERREARSRMEAGTAEITQLRHELLAGQVVGQAVGILMGRHGMGEDDAFGFLLRFSMEEDVALREVARRVLASPEGGRGSYPPHLGP